MTKPQNIAQRLRLWFAVPFLGQPSEVWLGRQAQMITRFDLEALCWSVTDPPAWEPPRRVHMIDSLTPGRNWPSGHAEGRLARWLARLENLPSGNFYRADRRGRRQLAELAAQHPPDIILAHFGQTGLALAPFARQHGIPLVVHFHGYDLSSALRNRWYRWSLMRQLNRFDGMIVVGSRQRDWLLAQGAPENRVHLIPCGVPVAHFRRTTTLTTAPARFITVSRLVAQKGVDICLEAFAHIASQLGGPTLTVIGDGPERAGLEARAHQPDLAGRVSFVGSLTTEQVREVLEGSTALLQHSLDEGGWYEGFGVSVTEAAAMEMPVIVSRCGGLTDQVIDGETGFVVDQADVAGMAQAMYRLTVDPDLCIRMGRRARANVVENFDTALQVCKLETVLMETIKLNMAPGRWK